MANPPPSAAEFPVNVQLVTVGTPPPLTIPPPQPKKVFAEFWLNVQLITLGLP